MLPVSYVLTFAACLFAVGLYGTLVQRNAIRILMSIELMLNAVNVNFVVISRMLQPERPIGQVFSLFVIAVAAAEAAIGLAIILLISRRRHHIDISRINLLRW